MTRYKIDCSEVHSELTDFAFDQLESSPIHKTDYEEQIVTVDTEPKAVKKRIYQKCTEKLRDMEYEVDEWDIGYTESELDRMRQNLRPEVITITEHHP